MEGTPLTTRRLCSPEEGSEDRSPDEFECMSKTETNSRVASKTLSVRYRGLTGGREFDRARQTV